MRSGFLFRVPKGKYELADIELYEEDYHLLQSAKKESEKIADIPITWSGNKVKIVFNNETNERFASLPIPYEKGWTVYINGKKSEVLQANYAFMGLSIKEGINTIELVYYPPYFSLSLIITIVSLLQVLCWCKEEKRACSLGCRLTKLFELIIN